MPQDKQITVYVHPIPAPSHRVLIALADAKAEYILYNLDIWRERPDWFSSKVNPLGKIPAITYGGPKVAPDNPSPESAKLSESLAIIEFIADIFPESGLLPADPVVRARARMINNYFDTRFFPAFWDFFIEARAKPADILGVLETVQGLLPETGFAVGAWSIADVAIAPFLVRVVMLLENGLGKQQEEEGKEVLRALREPRFARVMKYIRDAKEWPSFKVTFNEADIVAQTKAFLLQRDN
ncbi:hypothetical protein L226DRAFT_555686 [Lentinus tigrinus ALCF2SS1-7]|uniref:GST N-terminal domain-containing protein n=1 Tax=Lentinus tigrinus ALCF2SS1-6 TaxID=1328759 RepID=A0A5C2RMR9_9APHY|nr:hypothetical protein L227DRAFT_589681 [Lentinus tigrinus ALCF2SS1-6]RPD67925.1 hypothetical protein L226DRAFT_555686 [Lentinus tigrinus ALCF2SS1-7]